MERETLVDLFYGEGRVPHTWATDCPVRFDTWLEFSQSSQEGIGRRVDVILAVHEEHGVQRVLDLLRQLDVFSDSRPIAAGSFVMARLTLEELVRAVLPMTNLYGVVRLAQEIPRDQLVHAAGGTAPLDPAMPQEAPSGMSDGIERSGERWFHLNWMVKLLAAVAESAAPASETGPMRDEQSAQHRAAILSVTSMLVNAHTQSSITQLPPGQSTQIDRRQRYPVVSVTTNRPAAPAVSRSRQTVKADAAETVFAVDCSSIGWAIVDSGIDATHPAFTNTPTTMSHLHQPNHRVVRAFNFVDARQTLSADATDNGRIDWASALPYLEMHLPGQPPMPMSSLPRQQYRAPRNGHGTHVAGVLGGYWSDAKPPLVGICPTIRLYDFRVLDDDGHGDELAIVMALQAVRHINEQAGRLAIAGVNISLSVPYDVATHSCGWTPVCIECDRLVRSGVIVVTAAGNTGYSGEIRTTGKGYQTVSISDPGNTDSVITVGSTHRSDPHRHGISYFSSRGPTADGRLKPDLLAPGEDIDGPIPGIGISAMHGTSQAAAHASGAAAMLVARYRELLGRPDRVKHILCSTATDLGRERLFQGHGLLDVLRAMQSV